MIEVRNLERSFGKNKILDDVSFRIEKGESVVIIGRSGGGKSVLLKHLIGLLKPDSGEILIDAENVAFACRRENLPDDQIARKVAEVLDMVELPGIENKNPAELSGGMRKRV